MTTSAADGWNSRRRRPREESRHLSSLRGRRTALRLQDVSLWRTHELALASRQVRRRTRLVGLHKVAAGDKRGPPDRCILRARGESQQPCRNRDGASKEFEAALGRATENAPRPTHTSPASRSRKRRPPPPRGTASERAERRAAGGGLPRCCSEPPLCFFFNTHTQTRKARRENERELARDER